MRGVAGNLRAIFPLLSAPGANLILKLQSAANIGERCLKEECTYYKVKGIIHISFVIFSFQVMKNSIVYCLRYFRTIIFIFSFLYIYSLFILI